MDKFSLWPMFQLNTEVESAEFDNETGLWNVRTQGGETHTAKYFAMETCPRRFREVPGGLFQPDVSVVVVFFSVGRAGLSLAWQVLNL